MGTNHYRYVITVSAALLGTLLLVGCTKEGDVISLDCKNGQACDDNNACTVNDICSDNVCEGEPLDCSSKDGACTEGVCEAGECVETPINQGVACDDGDACTVGDVCNAGTCAGTPMDCSGLDGECAIGACEEGECIVEPFTDGQSCDDGDACTVSDACQAGACVGSAMDCSDFDSQCTTGRCEEGECVAESVPEGQTCDDGDACTLSDACQAGTCYGAPMDCSGLDDQCNLGACESGSCVTQQRAAGYPCDDGDSCTVSDSCNGGTCSGTALSCSSLDAECSTGECMDGECLPVAAFEGRTCEDQNPFCMTDLMCSAGECSDDDGCAPIGWASTVYSTSTAVGGTSGGLGTLDCPTGHVLTGIAGAPTTLGVWSGALVKVRAFCSPVIASYPTTSTGVRSRIGENTTIGGGMSNEIVNSFCQPGQAIVELKLRSANLLGTSVVNYAQSVCRELSLIPEGNSRAEVSTVGPSVLATAIGSTVANTQTSCPAGSVAVGIQTRSGEILDSIALRCTDSRLIFE